MKWSLPQDPVLDALAAEVAARDELSPSRRALFHTLRTWDSLLVIAAHLAVAAFGSFALAAVVLVLLGVLGVGHVAACAAACAAAIGAHTAWQRLQRVLLRRLLQDGVTADSVGGAMPVAIPGTRPADEDDATSSVGAPSGGPGSGPR